MSFSYAKFIARRGGVVLASGPPVESVPGPTRCCHDHSLQTWRSLKHEVNTIRCVLFMFSAIRRYRGGGGEQVEIELSPLVRRTSEKKTGKRKMKSVEGGGGE